GRGMEVVLRAVGVAKERGEAEENAEAGDEVSPREPSRRGRADHAHGNRRAQRDPDLPAMESPRWGTPEPRVERQQVVEDDGAPGRESTDRREPEHRHQRRDGDGTRKHETGDSRCARPPDRYRHDDGEEAREDEGMRLQRHAGAESEPTPGEIDDVAPFEPTYDTERAREEEGT